MSGDNIMMYHIKNIISHDCEISVPNCMYHVKNPNESTKSSDIDIKISEQASNTNMMELENRQERLLKKLDILYERIKGISTICSENIVISNTKTVNQIPVPQEIVLNMNPDSLPYYLIAILKDNSIVPNITWHIHSSVPNEKLEKIKAFLKKIKLTRSESKINFRLIFKSGPSDSDLRYSSLSIPIVGNVNILRYFALIYPGTVLYDLDDYFVDGLLDLCYLLEKAHEKSKEPIILKLFAQYNVWIYKNTFSIVDLAAYSAIKQLRGKPKSVPKDWFDRCEQVCS